MFKFIVPSYNCSRWLRKSLGSIESQSYCGFDVCVIDDASTDEEQRPIIEEFCSRNGWKTLLNEKNLGALHNIVRGIELLECDDEDVILIVDGDDWLFNNWVLERLNDIYRIESPLVTYGHYVSLRTGAIGYCRKLRKREIWFNRIRKLPWLFSHLRTFKAHLWRRVKDGDLRGPDGRYFATTWDLAMMYPMIEMAGRRIKSVKELLYVYNDTNPLNDVKIKGDDQRQNAQLIRKKKPYQRLF